MLSAALVAEFPQASHHGFPHFQNSWLVMCVCRVFCFVFLNTYHVTSKLLNHLLSDTHVHVTLGFLALHFVRINPFVWSHLPPPIILCVLCFVLFLPPHHGL